MLHSTSQLRTCAVLLTGILHHCSQCMSCWTSRLLADVLSHITAAVLVVTFSAMMLLHCNAVMQDVVEPSAAATPAPAVDGNQAIAGLPGVDPDDPGVQAAVRNVEQGSKQGKQEDSNEGK